jgi:hypothetical protein
VYDDNEDGGVPLKKFVISNPPPEGPGVPIEIVYSLENNCNA